ncbi:MAG: hypothetical protein LBO71_00300 [Prevotellaceae bacterium]|nr:hypothetical protein [Prevotellaceae bacterium]
MKLETNKAGKRLRHSHTSCAFIPNITFTARLFCALHLLRRAVARGYAHAQSVAGFPVTEAG